MKPMTMPLSALMIITALSYTSFAGADSSEEIFVEPPSPETLARLLYGPRYRSAEPVAGRFGMMINFEYDSVKIVPESLPMLDAVGEMLGLDESAKEVLVIEGHADASGPAAYNQTLSERRADAIKRYLVGTFDILDGRLITIGEGESQPHDRKDPYAAVNRRVVFRTTQSIVVD